MLFEHDPSFLRIVREEENVYPVCMGGVWEVEACGELRREIRNVG